jgi:hypothetical protein
MVRRSPANRIHRAIPSPVSTDHIGSLGGGWMLPTVDHASLARLGIKAEGGGPHQSKTMMLADLSALIASGRVDDPAGAIVGDNLLGKPSIRAREAALYRLRQL